jgi:hypothetical protein
MNVREQRATQVDFPSQVKLNQKAEARAPYGSHEPQRGGSFRGGSITPREQKVQ